MLYIHKSRYMIQMSFKLTAIQVGRDDQYFLWVKTNFTHFCLRSSLLQPENSDITSHVSPLWRMTSNKESRSSHSPQVCGGSCPAGQTGCPPGWPASGRLWQRTAGLATGPPWVSLGWRLALHSVWGAAALFVAAAAESDIPPPAAPNW